MTRAERRLNGWLVIDKPQGLTSSRVVERVRRAAGAKAGHAGTLDPLATGVLPVALGEATKTIAYAVNGPKRYRFRIHWGIARSTDDAEGEIVSESSARPDAQEISAVLPRFIGKIAQVPPAYSAIRVAGRRSYALARAGRSAPLPARPVEIFSLALTARPEPDIDDFEATVGKGTYIRALARDLSAALGTLGYIAALRRLSVGPFTETDAVSLEWASCPDHFSCLSCGNRHVLPVATAVSGLPTVMLEEIEANRLRSGQQVPLHMSEQQAGRFALTVGASVAVWHDQALIALASYEGRSLRPLRVLNS